MNATLFDVTVVYCFACPHKVHGTTPQEAHDLMEAHYARNHAALIARLSGKTTAAVTGGGRQAGAPMSAFPSTSWTIICDHAGCFGQLGPAEDTTRAALRKRAAKQGWTTAVGQAERYSIRSWSDFCPAHKPAGGDVQ